MSYDKPVPAITASMRPFFDGAKQRHLCIQRCRNCGSYRFPARAVCATCLSETSDWVPVSGQGEVFSFCIMHQVYHPAFASEAPYAVVLVRLDEGPTLTSNLVGVAPEATCIGMPVRVVFEDITPEVTLPKFVPAREAGSWRCKSQPRRAVNVSRRTPK
jgi:uncharacterized OB-fold protein